MARVRVKICGITRVDDAIAAERAGADAIGLVFYPPSSRNVVPEPAAEIAAVLGAFTTTVGLFVNPEPAEVERVLASVRLDRLQFHGDESEDFCRQFGIPYLKALRTRPGADLAALAADYSSACGILLDSYKPGVAGGTGETFDWSLIPESLRSSIILAGGLNPDNVAAAIQQVRPAAVDVSGGVESAPGIKSEDRIRAFIEAVNRE
ncbi:phosphoribosylanthranilate isomerase [Litorivivens lipolytica]|uniref:N-(5'-phosphoribosyl)anthranilate isomerase n=1 Tax=Litorivivens lipolytica TaxID=1524264 RepID=A0A7W4W2H7_9GAMM|nr:phosphoribosylanthranilate isomerase [Litorivivens lipolytica]MBB3046252.1 phosphoribosylanthranilate isomerase [Litorivivens lipolytica]